MLLDSSESRKSLANRPAELLLTGRGPLELHSCMQLLASKPTTVCWGVHMPLAVPGVAGRGAREMIQLCVKARQCLKLDHI